MTNVEIRNHLIIQNWVLTEELQIPNNPNDKWTLKTTYLQEVIDRNSERFWASFKKRIS